MDFQDNIEEIDLNDVDVVCFLKEEAAKADEYAKLWNANPGITFDDADFDCIMKAIDAELEYAPEKPLAEFFKIADEERASELYASGKSLCFNYFSEKQRKFLFFENDREMVNWLNREGHKSAFECVKEIPGELRKLYIDYDWSSDREMPVDERKNLSNFLLNSLIDCANEYFSLHDLRFTTNDVCVIDATGWSKEKFKFSKHFVFTRHAATLEQCSAFCQFYKQKLGQVGEHVDPTPYMKFQQWRLPGHSKFGDNRPLKIESNHDVFDALIRVRAGRSDIIDVTLPQYMPAVDIKKPVEILYVPDDEVKQILEATKPHWEGHRFHKRKGNLLLFVRGVNVPICAICDRLHENRENNPMFFVLRSNGDVEKRCVQCEDKGKFILVYTRTNVAGTVEQPEQPVDQPVDQPVENRNEQPVPAYLPEHVRHASAGAAVGAPKPPPREINFNLRAPVSGHVMHAGFRVEKFKSADCQPLNLDDCDTLIVRSPVGTGKTKQLRNYIATLPEDFHVVIVSFRRSFTSEICAKLGFADYRKIKGQITAPRVVIQYESLHRLQLPVGKQCLVVLDESESILTQIENKQLELKKSWLIFEWLCKYSTLLICMDALADFRTYQFISQLGRMEVKVQINEWKQTDPEKAHRDIYYRDRVELFDAIFKAAVRASEEPFVFVANSLRNAERVRAKCAEINPLARIKMYSSKSSEEERKDFDNVTEAWPNVDILIYTSTLSAGVSYEEERFTRVFAYFSNRSCCYQTAIQMLGRVRNISSREFHIAIKMYSAQYPDSVPEIEKSIATADFSVAEKIGMEILPIGATMVIAPDGAYEYPHKDLFYWTHIYNLQHRLRSMNYFDRLFIEARRAAGAVCQHHASVMSGVEIAEANKKLKQDLKVQESACAQEIAGARMLDFEEYHELKLKEFPTMDIRAALAKFELVEYYSVPPEKVTTDFVKKYNDPKPKAIFSNLRAVCGENALRGGKNIQENVLNWARGSANRKLNLTDGSIDDLTESRGLIRCMFCIDILNQLFNDVKIVDGAVVPTEMTRDLLKFCDRYIAAILLVDRMQTVMKYINEHSATIQLVFKIERRHMKARTTTKNKLQLVNKLLRNTFDISIVAADPKERVRNMYKLKVGSLFTVRDGWVRVNC